MDATDALGSDVHATRARPPTSTRSPMAAATSGAPVQLKVSCLLTRYYNFALEATLDAIGFQDAGVDFVDPNFRSSDDVVVSSLPADVRVAAAQHVSVWRRCGASNQPVLIFEEDVSFSSACDVFKAAKAMAATLESGQDPGCPALKTVMFLGAAEVDPDQPSVEVAGGLALAPMRSASATAAYVLWPAAARLLLESLPLDVPAPAFIGRHVEQRLVLAMMASPALAFGGEAPVRD